jgi:hypothetical protein
MRDSDPKDRRYRLYDEHLVRTIMLSAAIAVSEYLRENPGADSDEVCDFIDANAESIMSDTVNHMKSIDDAAANDGKDDAEEGGDWLSDGKER